jgi:hypothetical protein
MRASCRVDLLYLVETITFVRDSFGVLEFVWLAVEVEQPPQLAVPCLEYGDCVFCDVRCSQRRGCVSGDVMF